MFYWVWVFNLQITVTTDSYLSLKTFRGYVNRVIWVQGNICVLRLRLIYQRIYGKNLTAGFSKSMLYLIGQIEVQVEFSELSSHGRVIKIWDFYWLSIALVACKKWQHGKIYSLLFKIFLTPFYPVSGRHFFLPGMGPIAFSFLNPVFEMNNDENW